MTASDAVAHTLIILKSDFSRYTLFLGSLTSFYMESAESHPIPQDVTGFQFKIIGDITVKQFAYLAGPSFVIWFFFQTPISLFIKLPFSILLGGLGASLAFLPIAGRPMDTMIANFIKALFKPTLFVYQKGGGNYAYARSVQGGKAQKSQKHDTLRISQPSAIPQASTPNQKKLTQVHTPTISPQEVLVQPSPQRFENIQEQKNEAPKRKVSDLEKDLEAPKKVPNFSPAKDTLESEKQLQLLHAQKEQLTKQLIGLQQQLDLQKKSFFSPTIAKTQTQTQNVRQIPKGMGKNLGLPFAPEAPNIITGIIKDPRGNPLGNILVEVKDNEGNPVRAFKTNGLGQFASATSLTNGAYTVSFEDPKGQSKFDAIGFKAEGTVILPIEVISIDRREELKKSLFGEN